jgi:hypothetical protein
MSRARYDYEEGDSRFGTRQIVYVDRKNNDGGSGCAKLAWGILIILGLFLVGGGAAVFMGFEQMAEGAGTSGQGVMSAVREMAPVQRTMEIEPMPVMTLAPDTLPVQPGDCSHIHWEDGVGGSDFSKGYQDPCWWAFPAGMQKAYLESVKQ